MNPDLARTGPRLAHLICSIKHPGICVLVVFIAFALHDLTLQSFLLGRGVVWSSPGRDAAPAVATGEAGIAGGLACGRIGATGCARASVGLSAVVRAGILVDAIVVGNPGAIAAVGAALQTLVLRPEAAAVKAQSVPFLPLKTHLSGKFDGSGQSSAPAESLTRHLLPPKKSAPW